MVVFENVTKEDLAKLIKRGYQTETPKTIHEAYRLSKNGITLILYNSQKLLLQGKEDQVQKISEHLEQLNIGQKTKVQKFRKETGWIIGSDETLKGDTFGGIVVAAVKADHKIRKKLIELGVDDSKKLRDPEIIIMAEKIKRIAPCEIKSLLPEEYNKKHGQTELLNQLHQECAKFLFPGTHIVDKFPGAKVGSIRETKAESKYVEVAAASVLARAAGLQQFDYLSTKVGFTLPKGSTHVKEALQKLKDNNIDFKKFVKVDFRNVTKFLK
ncbi:MAG: hypothetical protein KKH52_04000 [Nanoarchaeota archaeon]|nr:hypothetical protein [Nanoarchaeota archaeon]MBU1622205.1 hypothetical protein [Nanoarchaeota archaeon]MBU1974532.1 hypothetical protein [Nanoarchaeota archaeon]